MLYRQTEIDSAPWTRLQSGRMQNCLRSLALLGLFSGLLVAPACAQNHANVSIDLSSVVNYLTETSLGVPTSVADANSFNRESVPYLHAVGIYAARYPGTPGVADLYHWSTHTTTPYKGKDAGYFAPESNFGNFAQMAGALGQAVIVVNYGSNFDGSGGGEPAEAAAWVAYANGSAGSTLALGKDSTGQDWKTAGYWATLRGQAPLATDDGLNFLRIQHPQPFGFKLWQIGDEVYNNGYYGEGHTGTADLHGPAPDGPKDFAKLKGNPKLSPSAFADNLKGFARAMKAVDPTIEIGAALTNPPDPNLRNKTYWDKDGEHADPSAWMAVQWGLKWNEDVLKGACSDLDFVTLDWAQSPMLPPDWKTLDEAALLTGTKANFAILINGILNDYSEDCPKGHLPKLTFAPAAIVTWAKVTHPEVSALWLADTYATLIESGTINSNWGEMYGDSMLSADRKKLGTAFHGLLMLHVIAHAPGDAFLNVSSSASLLSAHATFRRDGYVGIMLINKDPQNSAEVKVSVKNGKLGTQGRRIDYGSVQIQAGKSLSVAPFTATGDEFTVTVPPYTITDLLLPRVK